VGTGKASVLYSLKEPLHLKGDRPALEIRYTLSGAARLDLYSKIPRGKPFLSLDLAQGPGELQWILPLSEGTSLAALRFTAQPIGKEAGKGALSRLAVLGLKAGAAEFGFEIRAEGARFSQGASLSRNTAAVSESLRVEHPYQLTENPVIELSAKRGTVRLRASEGRSAVLSLFESGSTCLPLSALGSGTSITAETDTTGVLERLFIRASGSITEDSDDGTPLALDLATVLALPEPRDPKPPYSLFRWSVLPETLIFDFRDYPVQDAYLKRLAFFVEKEGFRGRLASDAAISKMHGWNANDYRAKDLAAFFDKAERASFPLSREERELKEILIKNGILNLEGDRVQPGEGALISISRESSSYFRRLFLNHEASHALFFLDKRYRQLAESLWRSQSEEERRFWNIFLSNRDYDPEDAYLSYNEYQAYMVQQSLSQLESWLRDVAYARLAKSYPDKATAILEDLETAIPGFKKHAASLDAYLRETYGLRAGSFERIRFE